MGISDTYNSLRSALAREAKVVRLNGAAAYGAPSERDYMLADLKINAMSHTSLLVSLEAHEEQST